MVSVFHLWLELKRLGILRTARVNCLADFPIVSEKDLKKRNHGSSSYFLENGHNDSGLVTDVYRSFTLVAVPNEQAFLRDDMVPKRQMSMCHTQKWSRVQFCNALCQCSRYAIALY